MKDLRGRLSFLLLSVTKISDGNDSREQGLALAHGNRGLLVHRGGETVTHYGSELVAFPRVGNRDRLG